MDKIEKNYLSLIIYSLKGAIIALCVAMVLILVFAFAVKWFALNEGVINPINQIIKIVSIFFGVLGACKVSQNQYLLKGLLVGALFSLISFVLFSMLNNFTFSFTMATIWDMLFSALIGVVCTVAVYYKKK